MKTRATVRALVVTGVFALTLIAVSPVAAQIERVRDPNWTTPRTPDGQPDLQGIWGNKTITPIERPEGETRAYLSDEEMATLNQGQAISQATQNAAPARRVEASTNLLRRRPAHRPSPGSTVGLGHEGVAPGA